MIQPRSPARGKAPECTQGENQTSCDTEFPLPNSNSGAPIGIAHGMSVFYRASASRIEDQGFGVIHNGQGRGRLSLATQVITAPKPTTPITTRARTRFIAAIYQRRVSSQGVC